MKIDLKKLKDSDLKKLIADAQTELSGRSSAKMFKLRLESIYGRDPAVSHIYGIGVTGIWRKEVTGIEDSSGANSKRSRGVWYHWSLADGMYEVVQPFVSGQPVTYFIRVTDGEAVKIKVSDVQDAYATPAAV